MGKVRSLLVKSIIPAAIVIVSIWGIGAYGIEGQPQEGDQKHADVIMIDVLKAFGKLERPGVEFLHDNHTKSLEKKKKDCAACHLTDKDRLSLKFLRLKDDSKRQVMDLYHSRCIECHKQSASEGEKAGPVACGDCHKEKSDVVSIRQPMGLDKSLHFRHTKALENKCETCHHEYDEVTKKLFHAKEKEGSCRYCHNEVTEGNRISNRLASHIGCMDCHRKTVAAGKKAGPVQCSGCHDPKQQALIEKVKDVPRIKRNQPDAVLIKTSKEQIQPESRMNFTPFDHKAHEGYMDTCRVCHHEDLNACNKCHTLTGTKESKGVTLDRAMHQANVVESCKGCHDLKKADVKCAGCHSFVDRTKKDELACMKCHIKPLQQATEQIPKSEEPLLQPVPKSEEALMAKALLDSRSPVTAPFSEAMLKDIPEKVVIKALVQKYEQAEFPHRKIAQTLLKNIGDNKLAGNFHPDQMTICQGCHHNSPVSIKPPKCQSCHNRPFDEKNPLAPGLMGAYHQQCMGCHKAMGMEKPMGCTECHKEKK
jgi:hypothetical protein